MVQFHCDQPVVPTGETMDGFSPTSFNGSSISSERILVPNDVIKHNENTQGETWVIYKNKAYERTSLLDVLWTMREEKNNHHLVSHSQKNGYVSEYSDRNSVDNDDNDYETSDDIGYSDDSDKANKCSDSIAKWRFRGFQLVIPCGYCYRDKLETRSHDFCVGSVARYGDRVYWLDIRSDIKLVLDDLIRESLRDELSRFAAEYLTLLQRWMDQYRYCDPPQAHTTHSKYDDPNSLSFPLPQLVRENPTCLRSWMSLWEPMDTELPVDGAWPVIHEDEEEIDVTDSDAVFASSLREGCDLTPFDTSIEGPTAWDAIGERLVAQDLLTDNQIVVERLRSTRCDLDDLDRMRRRRCQLKAYFIKMYKFQESKMERFQSWADEMLRGRAHFLRLCDNNSDISAEQKQTKCTDASNATSIFSISLPSNLCSSPDSTKSTDFHCGS